MDKTTALTHYGTQAALAQALGISQASVAKWKKVPELRQLQIEALTGGSLKADKSILPRRTKKNRCSSAPIQMIVHTACEDVQA